MTALTVPEVLRRAEQVVAERGLHRGDFGSGHGGSVCVWGAINVVVFGTPWCDGDESEPQPGDALMLAALTALADYLGLTTHPVSVRGAVAGWNDDSTTTHADDVRLALLAAAERAEQSS